MSRATSPATQRALDAVRRGTPAHAAALAEGVSPSTIYRVLAKQRRVGEQIRPETEVDADEYIS